MSPLEEAVANCGCCGYRYANDMTLSGVYIGMEKERKVGREIIEKTT
jgi:hypothetical protein